MLARKAATPGFARLPFAARSAACLSAPKPVIAPKRLRAFAGTVSLRPRADLAARLVEAAGGVLVAAVVEMTEVVGEAEQEAELFNTEVGAGEVGRPSTGIRSLDERLQHVESRALDSVAEEEALGARKAVQCGDEPQDEAVVKFDGGTGLAGAVTVALPRPASSGPCFARFGLGQDLLRSDMARLVVACGDQGALPPGHPRARGNEVKTRESIDCSGDAEPEVAARESGQVPDAARGTEVPRSVEPGAAAQHTTGTVA